MAAASEPALVEQAAMAQGGSEFAPFPLQGHWDVLQSLTDVLPNLPTPMSAVRTC
jgi:hypothetical protein